MRFAWLHEHPHYGELSLVIFMDEMDFHGILLAVHSVLAWAMKVKLNELIFFAMNLYGVLSVGVDLYRMTVIDDFQRCSAIIESDTLYDRGCRSGDING